MTNQRRTAQATLLGVEVILAALLVLILTEVDSTAVTIIGGLLVVAAIGGIVGAQVALLRQPRP